MKKANFKAHAYRCELNDTVLQIMLVHEDGEDIIYSIYVNSEGEQTKITKSYVRYTTKNVPYFIKDNKRCYLDEFIKY